MKQRRPNREFVYSPRAISRPLLRSLAAVQPVLDYSDPERFATDTAAAFTGRSLMPGAYYPLMSSPSPNLITPDEYLELERKSEIRSEYIGGRIFAMSGASRRHNLIAGNLFRELSSQMRGRECEVYVSDMRVKIGPTGMYTYPDIAAVCGQPRFEGAHVDTLLNPMVIVEVLSESTEAYDRGEKFANYRRLDTLQEYVLVAQDKIRVEHYRREGEQWILSEISDPDSALDLPSIGCHVGLGAIYEKVDFNPLSVPS